MNASNNVPGMIILLFSIKISVFFAVIYCKITLFIVTDHQEAYIFRVIFKLAPEFKPFKHGIYQEKRPILLRNIMGLEFVHKNAYKLSTYYFFENISMSSPGTSSRHYRTLNIDAPCTWDQLKQQYRKLANTWHPDRLQDNPGKLSIAENKLKEINLAYAFFSTYYKKHGSLPTLEKRVPEPIEVIIESETSKDTVTDNFSNNFEAPLDPAGSEKSNSTGRRVITLFLLVVTAVIGWNYINQTDTLQEADPLWEKLPPEQYSELTGDINKSGNNVEKNITIPQSTKDQKYFSYGSTLGQVHDAQGTPTRTEGETWYYGKSKVRFTDGRVVSWEISLDDPLFVLADTLNINRSSFFVIGSTKELVLRIQGKPTQKSNDTWDYGLSRIYFFDGQVVNWYNSPMDPLKARK